jgi:arylsulfatase
MHGFDEFFGSLCHLNAEEAPENRDCPGDRVLANGKTFPEQFGPRGVLHIFANPDGTQRIENIGPLTKKRMETVDQETVDAAEVFIRNAVASGKPFFLWWNTTRMHFRTDVSEENTGLSGPDGDASSDGMVAHDRQAGELLALVDEPGIGNNTVVMSSTDNGPHYCTSPDAGTTPFRSEKNFNREGACRVPTFLGWPGRFPAGETLNGIVSHEDWLPAFSAIAGNPDIAARLRGGVERNGRSYRNCIDGYNQPDCLRGAVARSPRSAFWYVTDDGQGVAARCDDWTVVFLENRGEAFGVRRAPFVELRVPMLFNLRRDPFEKAQHKSNTCNDWFPDRRFVIVPIQALAATFLQTMADYPPGRSPGSFNLSGIEEQLRTNIGT